MKVKTRNVSVDFKTKDGRTVSVKGYETYQPERSKREDLRPCRMCKIPYKYNEKGCVCMECRKKYVRPTIQDAVL